MAEELDNIDEFEAKETSGKLPVGWLILFCALILWGIYYVATYSPGTTGWTQEKAYEQSLKK